MLSRSTGAHDVQIILRPAVLLSILFSLQAVEKIAKSGVAVILALSLIAARADLLWIGNSPLLNFNARQKRDKQTVWLRRILLLEVHFTSLNLVYGLAGNVMVPF